MPSILNTKYTAIDLSGATSTLDITEGYDSYVYYGTGSLLNNYTISPSTSPSSTTQFTIVKTGNIDLNGYSLTIFGETLNQEQASSDLIITCIYDLVNAVWAVNIEINSLSLPSIIEGVETTTVPTSGTKTLLPNLNSKWQVFSGSQTLAGNYTIDGTGVQNGDEFWVIWDSQCDINGNTLSIFGITIPSGDAIGGNFIVVAKYNGSIWETKFIDGHFGLWEEGSGIKSVKKLGSSSTIVGNYSTDLGESNNNPSGDFTILSGQNNTTSDNYAEATGDGNTASAAGAIAKGLNNTASGIYSIAVGDTNTVSGSEAVAIGLNNISSANQSIALGSQCTASASRSVATGNIAYAQRAGSKSHSSGRHSSTSGTYSQHSEVQALIITTDATQTSLLLNGSTGLITIPSDTLAHCQIQVTGVQQSGSSGTKGDSAVFTIWACIKNIGGVTSLVGTPLYLDNTGTISTTSAYNFADVAAATWDVTIVADNTNDALLIKVTGEANKTIYWHATVLMDEIKMG